MSIRQAADPVPLRQAVAELVALSDERDAWLQRLEAEYRTAFDLGYAIGVEAGRRQVLAEEAAYRRATAALVTGARPGRRYRDAAELDRRRYPPDGRASWLLNEGGDAA